MGTKKIAHVADCHYGMGYPGPEPDSRFDDIVHTMNFIADRIVAERPDLVVFAGDAFKDGRVMLDRARREIGAFYAWLARLDAAGLPVIVVAGTPSHDSRPAYELMREMSGLTRVHISLAPERVDDHCGCGVDVTVLPGLRPGDMLSAPEMEGRTPEELNRLMTKKYENAAVNLSGRRGERLSVLAGHLAWEGLSGYSGAGAENGLAKLMMQGEPILTRRAAEPYPLVLLGHIHDARTTPDGAVRYCGSPERLTFTDRTAVPGFLVHELSDDGTLATRHIATPARRFVVVEASDATTEMKELEDSTHFVCPASMLRDAHALFVSMAKALDGAVVSLSVSIEDAKTVRDLSFALSKRRLAEALSDAGAWHVASVSVDIPNERTNGNVPQGTVPNLSDAAGALRMWAEAKGWDETITTMALAQLAELERSEKLAS